MKITKKIIVMLIALLMLVSLPVQVLASADISFFGIGNSIVSTLPKTGKSTVKTIKKENIKITTSAYNARLNFDSSNMIYGISEYNILLNKWEEVPFFNNSNYLEIRNLSPNTYHKIKVTAGKRLIGVYTFTTNPANIKNIKAKATHSEVKLTWSNPEKYTTQVYRRMLTPEEVYEVEKAKREAEEAKKAKEKEEQEEETTRAGEFYAELTTENSDEETTVKTFDDLTDEEKEKCKWKLLDEVKDTKYTDKDVEGDNYYYYKVRYVCRTKKSTQYSDFRHFDEQFVPLEIDNIQLVNGFTIIRQNDPVNRLVPYEYTKGDGRTIGTSGCGVCAALMVVRNTSEYDTSLEAFTKEVIDAGGRVAVGSDLNNISKLMKSKYHFNYEYTSDIDKLKEHLKKGYMAVANVGASKYFSDGGHFVTIAGIVKDDDGEEVAIVLDPSFRESKYNVKHRKEAGLKYSKDGIVTAPFDVIKDDAKMLHYALYTPENAKQ